MEAQCITVTDVMEDWLWLRKNCGKSIIVAAGARFDFLGRKLAAGGMGSIMQKSFKQLIPDLMSGNEQVREDSVQVCWLDLGG